MDRAEVVAMLDRKAKSLGSAAKLARELRVSPQYLNDVLAGLRGPGDSILSPLGLERVVTYRKKSNGAK